MPDDRRTAEGGGKHAVPHHRTIGNSDTPVQARDSSHVVQSANLVLRCTMRRDRMKLDRDLDESHIRAMPVTGQSSPMSASATSRQPASRAPRWIWCVIGVFFAGYFACIAWYTTPHAAGADASGYLNGARLLLEGRLSEPIRPPPSGFEGLEPEMFLPLGFRLNPAGERLVPAYPIGQSLHLALFIAAFGPDLGPRALNVAAMLGCAVLLHAVARRAGVKPAWVPGMLTVWALSPLVYSYALQVMSETTSTFWVLLAVHAALRSGGRSWWPVLAGAALGMAVLIRPANLIAAIPVMLALWSGLKPRPEDHTPDELTDPPTPRRDRKAPVRRHALAGLVRSLALVTVGGAPFALILGGANAVLYGSVLATGYGPPGELFSLCHLGPTVAHYAIWLPVLLTPLVVAALGLPFLRSDVRTRVFLAAWAGVFLGFYATYYHTHETWWTLRLVVPALPALAIAATRVLQHWERPLATVAVSGPRPVSSPAQWRRFSFGTGAVFLVAALAWQVAWQRHFGVHGHEPADRVFPLLSQWTEANLPAGAVLLAGQASGALYHYTDRSVIHLENLDPGRTAKLDACLSRQGTPLFAVLLDHEEARAFASVPGSWERVVQIRQGAVWQRVTP